MDGHSWAELWLELNKGRHRCCSFPQEKFNLGCYPIFMSNYDPNNNDKKLEIDILSSSSYSYSCK